MCKWYCTSDGPSTNLQCLQCGVRYCAACLHGEAGKMVSLVKCAACGKCPTRHANTKNVKGKYKGTTRIAHRPAWVGSSAYGSRGLGSSSASSGNARGIHASASLQRSTQVVSREEAGKLLPGWVAVENPNWTGKHDRVYYINTATRETTWEKPVVPPPPPPQTRVSMTSHARKGVPARVLASREKSQKGSSIFERLTDTSAYTGTHKHRFDSQGRGRGISGRDAVAKGRGSARGRRTATRAYVGNTNTNTDQTFNSISEFLVRR